MLELRDVEELKFSTEGGGEGGGAMCISSVSLILIWKVENIILIIG